MTRARLIQHRLHLLAAAAFLVAAAGCYTGSARNVAPTAIHREAGWLMVDNVPFLRQRSESDCGAAALAMMLSYWGVPASPDEVTTLHPTTPDHGIKAGQLRDFARGKGLQAYLIKGQPSDLVTELSRRRPVLVGLAKPYGRKVLSHYEVVIGFHKERRLVLTLDPAHGWRQNSLEGFAREWVPTEQLTMVMFRGP